MSDVHVSDPNTIPSEDHVDDPLLTIENVTEWRATADVFDAFFTRQIASIYCHVTADRGIPLPDRDTGAVDGWEAVKTEADELRNCWLRTWYESEELGFGKENPSRPQELAAAITALRQAAIRNHDAMEEIYSSLERYVHGTDSLAADEFSTAFHQYVKDGYDPVSTLNSLSFTDKTAASLLQSISDCHSRLEDFREAVRLTVVREGLVQADSSLTTVSLNEDPWSKLNQTACEVEHEYWKMCVEWVKVAANAYKTKNEKLLSDWAAYHADASGLRRFCYPGTEEWLDRRNNQFNKMIKRVWTESQETDMIL